MMNGSNHTASDMKHFPFCKHRISVTDHTVRHHILQSDITAFDEDIHTARWRRSADQSGALWVSEAWSCQCARNVWVVWERAASSDVGWYIVVWIAW